MKEKALLAHTKALEQARKRQVPRDQVVTSAKMLGQMQSISRPGLSSFAETAVLLARLNDQERRRLPDQINTLPEDQQPRARTQFMTFQASNYPEEAAAWLKDQTTSPDFTEQASRLAAHWVLDDAPAAAEWAAALPAGESKVWALWNLARQWQRVDGKAAQNWASRLPQVDRAVLESAFAGRRP